MFIFASQIICSFPFQTGMLVPTELPLLLIAWIIILRNMSSFVNGIILLLSERRRRKKKINISKETGFLKDLAKFPST